ncbi:MAG: long-chain fatty acid--CoA ligase [Chloroflexota bacterium]|nr:long-chain fatty acid--CoA ligase [Chloroflexota bacterium]
MVTYADRPWFKWYDAGVPHSIQYPDMPLHQFLRDTARKTPSAPALVTSAHLPIAGRVASDVSYGELDSQSDALAAGLVDIGLKKGDRVALIMPNIAAFVISYYGILKAGGVVAAMNPTYPAERMQFHLDDCDAEFAICMSLFYPLLQGIRARTKLKRIIVTNVKEYLPTSARILFTIAKEKKTGHRIESLAANDLWFQDLLTQYAGQRPDVEVHASDLAIFQYTGGTTGVSKAAMSTHSALVANNTQCQARLLGADKSDKTIEHIFLGAIPFFHVYGLITVVGFAVALGARIALVPNARDIPDLLDVIQKFKPTVFMGVPALYNAINNHPDVLSGKISLRSIQVCLSGSAPLAPATKRDFERLSGGILREGFGMSEAPTATHANPLFGENRLGSIGLPFPDMQMRIVSLEDSETDVPVGEIGELLMAGPQLMTGYHKKPEETAATLRVKDGITWLYTGDIARMDEDGYFYIVDRKKDMAIIGGYNVYPNNVEKILADHPCVQEVGVAAIPHPEKTGQEALKAWIVLRPGQTATENELCDFASSHLTRYEIPTRFAFVDSLPKTSIGKTLRRELVQMELAARKAQQPI